jgi:hypothetical protein
MFFVPMGALKTNKWFLRDHLKPEHVEALKVMFDHTIYWAEDIIKLYMVSPIYLPVRFLLRYFMAYVKWKVKKVESAIEEIVKK